MRPCLGPGPAVICFSTTESRSPGEKPSFLSSFDHTGAVCRSSKSGYFRVTKVTITRKPG
jgi:hypothetical protein